MLCSSKSHEKDNKCLQLAGKEATFCSKSVVEAKVAFMFQYYQQIHIF